jgi:hypothetical protein
VLGFGFVPFNACVGGPIPSRYGKFSIFLISAGVVGWPFDKVAFRFTGIDINTASSKLDFVGVMDMCRGQLKETKGNIQMKITKDNQSI